MLLSQGLLAQARILRQQGLSKGRYGKPFWQYAPTGELITAIFHELGIKRKDLYISNVTRCYKGPGGKITPLHIKTCKPYLLDEISIVDPKYIVLAGNEALKAIFGHEGITKEHGTLKTGPDGRKYFPIIHPAAALPMRYPEYRVKIKEALAKLIVTIRSDQNPLPWLWMSNHISPFFS